MQFYVQTAKLSFNLVKIKHNLYICSLLYFILLASTKQFRLHFSVSVSGTCCGNDVDANGCKFSAFVYFCVLFRFIYNFACGSGFEMHSCGCRFFFLIKNEI